MATKDDTQRSITAICLQCGIQSLSVIAALAALVKGVSVMIAHQAQIEAMLLSIKLFGNTFGHTLSSGWAFWAWCCLLGYFSCVALKTYRAGHAIACKVAVAAAIFSFLWAVSSALDWNETLTAILLIGFGGVCFFGVMIFLSDQEEQQKKRQSA